MSKQDRQGARTPADLERKYEFGESLFKLESETKKQSEQIDRQNRTMDEFIENSSDSFASLERDISRAKKDISNLKLNVTSFSIRLASIEKGDKATSQSISGLAQRVSKAEQKISGMESTVNNLTSRLETAESTIADLVARVTALEST